MYVIPLKRSVSRQLVACVKGPKSGSKRRQIAKTSQKSKVNFSPNRKCHFFVSASLKFFSRHDIYMFIFVITWNLIFFFHAWYIHMYIRHYIALKSDFFPGMIYTYVHIFVIPEITMRRKRKCTIRVVLSHRKERTFFIVYVVGVGAKILLFFISFVWIVAPGC